jgi:hypothetical protein
MNDWHMVFNLRGSTPHHFINYPIIKLLRFMFNLFRTASDSRREHVQPVDANRRAFMRYAGASVAATTLLATACSKDDNLITPGVGRGARAGDVVRLGTGDVAVLNYAYALEQLEAAFYTMVVASGTLMGDEMTLFTDIRDHEIAHREFFKNALGSAAIPDLTPNFSMIDFKNRAAIIDTAMTFEDLGVAAYNGAGKFIKNADYLVLAGKIVSVEARHAAYIRELKIKNNGSNNLTPDFALDFAKAPGEVLTMAGPFIQENIDINGSGLIG